MHVDAGRKRRGDNGGGIERLMAAMQHEQDFDIVLVKASNSEQLWRLADTLVADARARA